MTTKRRLTLVFLFSVVVLSMVGVSYALWFDSLYVDTWIETGDIDLKFTGVSHPDGPGAVDLPNTKNVGWVYVVEWWEGVNAGGQPGVVLTDELHIELHNVYPCYYADFQLELTCLGSIPIHITSIEVIPDNFVLSTGYGEDDGEIWVELFGPDPEQGPVQMHQGDWITYSLKIHIEQPALQDTIYTFTVVYTYVNYNEALDYFP